MGLRTVAFFEAVKGSVVIVLLLFIVAVHHHVEDIAASLLYHLHIDPDRRASEAFLDAAERLRYSRLFAISFAAIIYAAVRYIESWGLWNRRVWAEWFALLSGAMYLPWEAIKFAEHPNWFHVAVISINVLIVLYMLEVRVRSCRPPANCDESKRLA